MHWMKALALVVAVSVLAAPIQALAVNAGAPSALLKDYAAREGQAADLESFTGGWHGVVLTLILVGVVVWVVLEVFHHEHPETGKPAPSGETPKP